MDSGFELKGDADLSPDGKRLVHSSRKLSLEIWAMENFLPDKDMGEK